VDLSELLGLGGRAGKRLAGLGTTLDRPPGTVLALRDAPADQAVLILDGRVVAVGDEGLRHLDPGEHLGCGNVLDRRHHRCSAFASSEVRIHVLSRPEFRVLALDAPELAGRLVASDRETTG
jgi:CRP-like cAMP-binding protein